MHLTDREKLSRSTCEVTWQREGERDHAQESLHASLELSKRRLVNTRVNEAVTGDIPIT